MEGTYVGYVPPSSHHSRVTYERIRLRGTAKEVWVRVLIGFGLMCTGLTFAIVGYTNLKYAALTFIGVLMLCFGSLMFTSALYSREVVTRRQDTEQPEEENQLPEYATAVAHPSMYPITLTTVDSSCTNIVLKQETVPPSYTKILDKERHGTIEEEPEPLVHEESFAQLASEEDGKSGIYMPTGAHRNLPDMSADSVSRVVASDHASTSEAESSTPQSTNASADDINFIVNGRQSAGDEHSTDGSYHLGPAQTARDEWASADETRL